MTGPIAGRGRSLRELVPAAYLLRDADPLGGNGMLGTLLDLLDAEIATFEDELTRRYASLFVETCDDDDLVHFAALLGVTQLPGNQHPRALIGNIIGYRRGKGTIATLERVAAATSGWGAHAVDYFRLLGTTQNVGHLRPGAATVALREPGPLEWARSPFDPLAHLVDVRTAGRYDIPDVGVHLWRLGPVSTIDPSDAAPTSDPLRFRFHPLGVDAPLYSIGRTLDALDPTAPVTTVDITEPIRPAQLRDALADYYGEGAGQSICVYDDGVAIPVAQVAVQDLSDRVSGAWGTAAPTARVVIDPRRGRLAFAATPAGPVSVRSVRARPAEIGSREIADTAEPTVTATADNAPSLAAALAGLPGAGGIVELAGSGRYSPAATLPIADGATVTIRASSGNIPLLDATDLTIDCGVGARLTLTGLSFAGAPLRVTGSPASLTLNRCTLVSGATLHPDGTPGQPEVASLVLDFDDGAGTAVRLDGCLTGAVRLGAPDATLTLADCVVAGAGGPGGAALEPVLVGAALTPFPSWPAGPTGLRLEIGADVVLDLTLDPTPSSIDQAAQALRDALDLLILDPDVASAVDVTQLEILVHGDRLVIAAQPGAGPVGASDPTDDGISGAATLLGLTTVAGGYSATSLLGDPIPDPPVLATLPAQLSVELGLSGLDVSPVPVQLLAAPASRADAAAALEAALPPDGSGTPFVLDDGGRLRVIPAAADFAVRFADAPASRALGLYGPAPVVAGSSDGLIPAPGLTADRVTVLGSVHVVEANVSDSIVTGELISDRRQVGCVRYSYLGAGSRTPKQFASVGPDSSPPPQFTSLRFAAAGFAQLTPTCPAQIARGGEDGSEMGAFAAVHSPLRLAAVSSVLAEYLRLTAAGAVFLES